MANKKKEKTKWLKSSFIRGCAFLVPGIRAVLWRKSPGFHQIRKTLTSTSSSNSPDDSNNFRHQACIKRLLITETGAIKRDQHRNLLTKFLLSCKNFKLHVSWNTNAFISNTNSISQFYSQELHFTFLPETYQQANSDTLHTTNDWSDVLQQSQIASFDGSGHFISSPTNEVFAELLTRLCTFRLWPYKNIEQILQLAVSGFYYIGVGDIVKCFHCHGQLQNWKPRENPFIEHLRTFRTCGFIRQEKDCFKTAQLCTALTIYGDDNVVLENNHYQSTSQSEVNNETPLSSDSSTSLEVVSAASTNNSLLEGSGNLSPFLHIHQSENVGPDGRNRWTEEQIRQLPFHLQYSSYQRRISSFQGTFPMFRDLINLAQAGFFYAGYGDAILCFYCGGGLWTLSLKTDIYKVHALRYPNCGFIQCLLGPEIVKSLSTSDQGVSIQGGEAGHYIYNHEEEDVQQISAAMLCRKCRLKRVSLLFFPCCHLVLCMGCGMSILVCFVCRTQLSHFKRVLINTSH